MDKLHNAMRVQAARQAQLIADSRMGIVTSYDPKQYACKVIIMPEGAFPADGDTGESGWLPVQTIWSGPGWGIYCPPSVGDQVFVAHAEGDPGSGQIVGRVFDASHLPLAVQSGEFWLVHASGSCFKFTNDGNVTINAATKLIIEAVGDCNLTVGGNLTSHASAWAHNGNFTLNGNAQINGTTNGTGEGTFNDIDVSTHDHTVLAQAGSTLLTTNGPQG